MQAALDLSVIICSLSAEALQPAEGHSQAAHGAVYQQTHQRYPGGLVQTTPLLSVCIRACGMSAAQTNCLTDAVQTNSILDAASCCLIIAVQYSM